MADRRRLTDARLDRVVADAATHGDPDLAHEVGRVVSEVRRLRAQLAVATERLEAHQIADWIRFLPPERVGDFLGEMATAAVSAEIDGDAAELTGVLTEWMALADAVAAGRLPDSADDDG